MEDILKLINDRNLRILIRLKTFLQKDKIKNVVDFLLNKDAKIEDKTLADKIENFTKESEEEAKHLEENLNQKFDKKKKLKIYLDGVFDIIHSGHFNAIRQASKLGDILLCGVNSDEDVLKNKGPTLMNVKERAMLAKACKWCDEAAENTPFSPDCETLDKYGCDYCSHGDDITFNSQGISCLDNIIKANRLKIFKRTAGISTTEIIGRLLASMGDKFNSLDMKDEKNIQLKKDFDEFLTYKTNKKPMMSSFLATSWRIAEFSNKRVPKPNDKIVYITGYFDILHFGHVLALEKVRQFGDFVYAGVFTDLTVHKILGKNYPILNMNERCFNLMAMRNVDEIVMGAPDKITEDMLDLLNIDVVVKFESKNKSEQEKKCEEEIYEIPKKKGILKEVEVDYDLSNEPLVERIWKDRESYIKKYLKKEKGGITTYKPEGKTVAEI